MRHIVKIKTFTYFSLSVYFLFLFLFFKNIFYFKFLRFKKYIEKKCQSVTVFLLLKKRLKTLLYY